MHVEKEFPFAVLVAPIVLPPEWEIRVPVVMVVVESDVLAEVGDSLLEVLKRSCECRLDRCVLLLHLSSVDDGNTIG